MIELGTELINNKFLGVLRSSSKREFERKEFREKHAINDFSKVISVHIIFISIFLYVWMSSELGYVAGAIAQLS